MKTSDFDFNLPHELIAQHPLENRSASRLLVLSRKDESIEHKHFSDILDYLNKGDVLVLNDTRVLPARLFGIKEDTNAHIECLILRHEKDTVLCMVRNARAVRIDTIINFGEGRLRFECIEILDQGLRRFRIISEGVFLERLAELGTVPLPPYIKEKLDDPERYQTVYAKHNGSAAAPTAGLHFTTELLDKIREKGIELCYITLHVGLGTFKPVDVDDVKEHVMHEEVYEVSQLSADILNKAKFDKRRIVAVGTTSVRTLESQMQKHGQFIEEASATSIFITPGYTFKAIDTLITNFHLPKSTLAMLVSAFANREYIIKAYECAIEEKYRFFSFGDSMIIQ
jgi:S-adenosylmethionine:tRNA ribosyltransferase-isomerase